MGKKAINVADRKGRDALVTRLSVSTGRSIRWVDAEQRQAASVRLLKATLDRDVAAIAPQAASEADDEREAALDKLADELVQGDPEVDIERVGSFLRDTARVYLNPQGQVVHHVEQWEIVRDPAGNEKQRRPRSSQPPNTVETPVRWSGKLMKKSEVFNRFVFSRKQQIVHNNGLTYDFLYGMAKELHDADSMMLVGAGPKGTQPLVFQRGGMAYRGFLEGRIDGKRYLLILHLSNMELKPLPEVEEKSAGQAAESAKDSTKPPPESKPKKPTPKADASTLEPSPTDETTTKDSKAKASSGTKKAAAKGESTKPAAAKSSAKKPAAKKSASGKSTAKTASSGKADTSAKGKPASKSKASDGDGKAKAKTSAKSASKKKSPAKKGSSKRGES